ncbi:MAG: hypothetical protein OHK0022_27670 [Roseiflexaceae bacterium]
MSDSDLNKAMREFNIGLARSFGLEPAPLQPAQNVRRVVVRACGSCKYLEFTGDGYVECQRPEGPVFDGGDVGWWWRVCDGWEQGGEQ